MEVFKYNSSEVTREDILDLGYDATKFTDEDMQEIVAITDGNARLTLGLSDKEDINLLDEKTCEIWWRELEDAVIETVYHNKL